MNTIYSAKSKSVLIRWARGRYTWGYVFFKSGWCSVTIFLTDLGGTVTQHDGNFLAVDGFPFFDGSEFGGYGNSNYGGTFTAVT